LRISGAFKQSLRLLRTRRFGAYFIATLLSNIGTWSQQIAEPWLLLSLGATSPLIGLDAFVQSAPAWMLILAGGMPSDKSDRRKVITIFQTSGDREKHLQRRYGELDREIDRPITNIAKGADFDTYNPKVNELAAERKRVKAELAQIATASEIVTVHPAAIEHYLADIRRLTEVAAEAAELDEPVLVETLRQLVQAVIVHAPPGTDELAIEIKASLSELTLPGSLLKTFERGGDRW